MVPTAEHRMRHAIFDGNYFRKTFSARRKFPRVVRRLCARVYRRTASSTRRVRPFRIIRVVPGLAEVRQKRRRTPERAENQTDGIEPVEKRAGRNGRSERIRAAARRKTAVLHHRSVSGEPRGVFSAFIFNVY